MGSTGEQAERVRRVEAPALLEPCPVHLAEARERCPIRPGARYRDACQPRRDVAEARRELAVLPDDEELAALMSVVPPVDLANVCLKAQHAAWLLNRVVQTVTRGAA